MQTILSTQIRRRSVSHSRHGNCPAIHPKWSLHFRTSGYFPEMSTKLPFRLHTESLPLTAFLHTMAAKGYRSHPNPGVTCNSGPHLSVLLWKRIEYFPEPASAANIFSVFSKINPPQSNTFSVCCRRIVAVVLAGISIFNVIWFFCFSQRTAILPYPDS